MPLLQPPTIPTFPAGYAPTPADFTGWAQNPFSFLAAKTVLRVRQTTAQAMTGSYSIVQFDTVDEDTYGGWSGSPYYFYNAVVSGWYFTVVTVAFAAAPANTAGIAAVNTAGTLVEGGEVPLATDAPGMVSTTNLSYLVGGVDYLQANAACPGGSINTSVATGMQSTMEIMWVGG